MLSEFDAVVTVDAAQQAGLTKRRSQNIDPRNGFFVLLSAGESSLQAAQFLRQQRHKLFQVCNNQHIGHFTDRRIFVGVDGDNEFRFFHPGQMLDRPGDAAGDVEFG